MTAVLQVEGVCKRFGGVVVADGVTISLAAGEIVGLIGPNGAGKTSLFNLISGVVSPDAGRIRLHGEPIERLRMDARGRLGLGRTWQQARAFASLSVVDNLLVSACHYPAESLARSLFRATFVRQAEATLRREALALLERIGLAAYADRPSTALSYGQQKLVGIARALMGGGKCLLLDEPMAGVEGRTYAVIRQIVQEEAASGAAVCIVEHNVAFIRDICSRGIFMAGGRVLASGLLPGLMQDPELTAIYFGATRDTRDV
jgi:branched-chain amino acid transport system ATP-binding protein